MNRYIDELGEPHVHLAGLKVWVHGCSCPSVSTDLSRQEVELISKGHYCGTTGSELVLANHVHELDPGEYIGGQTGMA